MFGIASMWLPILVSAVAVFVVSSIVHMLLPWHKNDYPRLANEDAVMDALRPLGIPTGEYFVPRPASREVLRSPEFLERANRGPVFILNMMPNGMMPMGKTLGLWFVYSIVVSYFAGHIAFRAITPPAEHHTIFHTVGLTAFMGYTFALWQMSIWYRRPWMTTLKATIDGFIYAAITAETFVLLWPS
jgi:hypothetical protein